MRLRIGTRLLPGTPLCGAGANQFSLQPSLTVWVSKERGRERTGEARGVAQLLVVLFCLPTFVLLCHLNDQSLILSRFHISLIWISWTNNLIARWEVLFGVFFSMYFVFLRIYHNNLCLRTIVKWLPNELLPVRRTTNLTASLSKVTWFGSVCEPSVLCSVCNGLTNTLLLILERANQKNKYD